MHAQETEISLIYFMVLHGIILYAISDGLFSTPIFEYGLSDLKVQLGSEANSNFGLLFSYNKTHLVV